jgi:hypothetical protein
MLQKRLAHWFFSLCVALPLSSLGARTALGQTAPVIEEVEPTSGPPGTLVRISGRRFSDGATVSIGSQSVAIAERLPNRLSIVIADATQSGHVAVTTTAGTVRGPEFRVTPPPPAPMIEAFDPPRGPPGAPVAIRGHGFSPKLTGNVVTLGGQPVVVRSVTPDELQVTIPDGATSGPFVVRVMQAGEASSKKPFEVTAATAVRELRPPRGAPGVELTIRGSGFSKTATRNRVYLNNVALVVKSASETELVVTLPHKVASGPVLVDVEGAGRAYSSDPFVVQRPPTLVDFAPKRGTAGTLLKVRGTNFGNEPNAIEVMLGTTKLPVREAHDTDLQVEVPEGAQDGKLSIRVNGVGPTWSGDAFTVMPVLRIARFSPDSGAAGAEVVIEGQGFGESPARNRVTIGGQAAHVIEASSTRIKVRVPKGKSGPIQVSVPGSGETRTPNAFVITVPPEVTGMAPLQGPVGTELTIEGSGFGMNPAVVKVTLGGRPLELKAVRDDAIVAKVVAGAKSGRVKVEIPLQGATEPEDEFTVTALSP